MLIRALVHDCLMVPVAWLSAFWLRENLGWMSPESIQAALVYLPLAWGIQVLSFWIFQVHRGVWRYSSLSDVIRIFKSIVFGVVLLIFSLFFINRLQSLPRSVLPLYGLLLLCFLSGSRVLTRQLFDRHKKGSVQAKRVLIIGSGPAAESLIRDLLRAEASAFTLVGIIDDRPEQRGRDIHGVRVLGAFSSIPKMVERYQVERLIIALPQADAVTMRHLMQLCDSTRCVVSTLPSMDDLVDGRVTTEHLRLVSLEDLLGRAPVELDWAAIRATVCGEVILVTGGGGSIGSELCRQILRLQPKRLIIVDNSEYHLFQLEQEFCAHFPGQSVAYHLVDVTDALGLEQIFKQHRPSSVYHAAAYKHVPLLEYQPREAVHNNVWGTENVICAALAVGVQRFLLVSTDKAVNPTNIMGASKRVAEIVCQRYQRHHPAMRLMMVRFGNVLGSRGSVVETFRRQIEAGGPVTVTHPGVMRYFMTIPEACQLILQAFVLGEGGDIFVLDMGEPIKISCLAEQMIRLAGKIPGEDIALEYTGLRPGEKLFEELFHDREAFDNTAHPKLFRAQSRLLSWESIEQQLSALKQAWMHYDVPGIRRALEALVPELPSALQENRRNGTKN